MSNFNLRIGDKVEIKGWDGEWTVIGIARRGVDFHRAADFFYTVRKGFMTTQVKPNELV